MSAMMYLIRHGATFQNEQRPVILQGNGIDGPLSDRGLKQAASVGQALSHLPLSAIYSSHMQRARQTAAAIDEHHRLGVQTIDDLHEVNVGRWEGKSWTEIMEMDRERYARFMADPVVPYLDGESYQDVLVRVTNVFQRLFTEHEGESFAVVAHNVVNRVYLCHLLMGDLNRSRHLRQSNCCINIIRRTDGDCEVVTVNSVLHLPD